MARINQGAAEHQSKHDSLCVCDGAQAATPDDAARYTA